MKVLVVGSCGAGKSTLAKRLSEAMKLPFISLDQCYWLPGWVRPEREFWRAQVKEIIKQEKWIMDGNFQNTFDLRFPASDVVVFLDFNRWVCLGGILKRRFLKNRVDPLEACGEQITFDLLKWVLWDHEREGRQAILNSIIEHQKKAVIIKSRRDLKSLEKIIKMIET